MPDGQPWATVQWSRWRMNDSYQRDCDGVIIIIPLLPFDQTNPTC